MKTQQILETIARGDESAVQFMRLILAISNTWDDLIDRDQPMSERRINDMMWEALIELPANEFYARHQQSLHPLLAVAILNWHAANQMERSYGDLEVAYILRSSFVDILAMVALLCGGRDHAQDMVPVIREATHHEGLAVYRVNLQHERAAREGV
ncbi:MAG TPA: hypothetical protein PKV98_04670 [Burkholderiaceae bacterium]|nr:hypothetical protein [Burkholderiaceae bacterium]